MGIIESIFFSVVVVLLGVLRPKLAAAGALIMAAGVAGVVALRSMEAEVGALCGAGIGGVVGMVFVGQGAIVWFVLLHFFARR